MGQIKMSKKNNLLLVAGFFSAVLSFGMRAEAQDLTLELSFNGGNIRVIVANAGTRPIPVTKAFSYGVPPAPVDLRFEIRDGKGRVLDYLDHQNTIPIPIPKTEWVLLRPGRIVGRNIPLSKLAISYGLRRGKYTIKAIYSTDQNSAVDGSRPIQLESNTITFVSDIDALKEFCDANPASPLRKNNPGIGRFCE